MGTLTKVDRQELETLVQDKNAVRKTINDAANIIKKRRQ